MSRALARYAEALHAVDLAEFSGTWDDIDRAHDTADDAWAGLTDGEERIATRYAFTLDRVDNPWDTRQLA